MKAGPITSAYGGGRIEAAYPLVTETLRLCFDLDCAPAGKSIEDLFADALASGNYGPVCTLAERLRHADNYIARKLASGTVSNCYTRFLQHFSSSNFLTFNYDSLLETLLFRLGRWYPRDGYGVPVVAHLPPWKEDFASKESSTLVLHLHGSLCIRTSDFRVQREPGQALPMLKERDLPRYAFDPSSISNNFPPFDRDIGSDDVENRIIAPIPDKSSALQENFIRDTYIKASLLARESEPMIAIGYSFNLHDRGSYAPVLRALSPGTLVVVSPDADTVADAIGPAWPGLSIRPVKAAFKEWAVAAFPLS